VVAKWHDVSWEIPTTRQEKLETPKPDKLQIRSTKS